MALEISAYRDSDQDGVVALWREAFPDEPPHNDPVAVIRRKLAVQPELFLVARVGGAVAGTAIGGFDGHRGWIYKVAVAAGQRRHGVGSALVRHAEEALRAVGCPKMNLQIRQGNADVAAFYESLGYAVEERISMGKHLA